MKRIDNATDLEGHMEDCFLKHNLDGTTCVLCFCEDKIKEEVKEEVKEEFKTEEFFFDTDLDED